MTDSYSSQLREDFASVRLANAPFRSSIERVVSAYLGQQWRVNVARDMADFASHPSATLSNGSYSVFAKFSDALDGREQFQIELAGLSLLSERSGVMIPTPIGIVAVEGGSILVLEGIREIERGPREWRDIGRALARIHKIKGEQFGLATNGYFGPLYQDNTPMADWPTFFVERRLVPGLKLAVDSGHMPPAVIRQVEKVISRVPQLVDHHLVPTLLHGDAQQNNFISTDRGAVVIDPAVYYGNPEMDLAHIDYFQPVPPDVFDGYREELPIDPGFLERREMWRMWGYLAVVSVEGGSYLGRLVAAVEKYV